MEKFSTSFCFFPCSAMSVTLQISHPAEDIQVHEDEIIGRVYNLFLCPLRFRNHPQKAIR